jgi:MFS family permease
MAAIAAFCQQAATVRTELVVTVLLVIPISIPLTIDSQLQRDTFGESRFYLYSGLLSGLQGLVAVVLSIGLGALSDHRGRTLPVLLCFVLMMVPPLVAALTADYLAMYLLRSLLCGYGAAFAVVSGSIVDKYKRIFRSEKMTVRVRTEVFSTLMVAFALGLVVGSGIGQSIESLPWKFVAQAGCCALGLLFTAAFGVGGKPTAETELIPIGAANSGSARAPLSTATISRDVAQLLRNRKLLIAAIVTFLDFLAEQMLQALLLLYAKDHLHFSSSDQLVVVLVVALSSCFGLVVVVRLLLHRMCLVSIMRLALIANAVSIGCIAFANRPMLMALPVGTVLGVLVFPTTVSYSAYVSDDAEAGAAQGLISAARFSAEGIAPALFGAFLQCSKGWSYGLVGIPFLVAGCCPLVAAALTLFLPDDENSENTDS